MTPRRHAPAALFALVVSGATIAAQERPLPDTDTFFAAVRENLVRAGRVQDEFAYKERRTQIHMNPFGRIGTGGTLLYDVMPIPDGPGFTRRLLEKDGEPVVDGEVDEFGRRRRRNRDRAQEPSAIEDTAAVLDFTVDRRELVDGRSTIVIRFAPKPDPEPRTREGRLARAFKGQIWVDEQAQEVMRVEAVAIDSISYGFGLLARLGEGTIVTLERERIEDDVWLPTSIRFKGEGRAMLLRKLHIDFAIEWFDYRRVGRSVPRVD